MVKKKSAKKITHKEETKKAEKIKNEEPLIQMNKSTVLTAVIFLLIGLIVGALVISALNINYSNDNSNVLQNDVNTKTKLTNYLNENFRDDQMQLSGITFFLEDSNNLSSDTLGYEVFVNIDGVVQPAGAIVYINGDNFVIASSYPINLNEAVDEIENSDNNSNEEVQGNLSESNLTNEQKEELISFNSCLAQEGLVIYGSATCPYCKELVESLGGYEIAAPIYVECSVEQERCSSEAKTGYVPELQLKGELYEGQRTLQALATLTGCTVPSTI